MGGDAEGLTGFAQPTRPPMDCLNLSELMETRMPYVRPDVQAMLAMLAAAPGPKIYDGDAATGRMMARTMAQFAERPRGPIAAVTDLTIPAHDGHAIPARLYRDSASTVPAPVLLYLHGGGWVIGDLDTYDGLCAEIARTLGVTVLSIDYRMGPEVRFPGAADDCVAAAQWLARSPAEIGHAVTGIVPGGDSAGGNLSIVLCHELNGKLPVPILAQWLIYPSTDMGWTHGSMEEFAEGYLLEARTMDWFASHYMNADDDLTHPRAAPLRAVSLTGQPPAMVYVCGLDPLRDQGRAYAAKLIEHGVRTIFREAAGQVHGSINNRAAIPSAHDDLLGCLADLRLLIDEAVAALPAAAMAAE